MTVLQLPRALLDAIVLAANQAQPWETGGVLMGIHDEGSKAYRVTELIGAGPNSVATRCTFDPDQQFQQAAVDRLFSEHSGDIEYLGDWHSHPGGTPSPSLTDRMTLSSIRRFDGARCGEPIMLIYGGLIDNTIHAFQLTRDGNDVWEVGIEVIR